MTFIPSHRDVEARVRLLLLDAELEQPDTVEYAPGSVAFLWTERKHAVVVDLDGTPRPDAERMDLSVLADFPEPVISAA